MESFNKSEFRSITITHALTGELRTFYVKFDGTQVISAARQTGCGFQKAFVHKLGVKGGNHGAKVYASNQRACFDFASKKRNMPLYTNRLVWAAWCNNGVMPPAGHEFHVDHVDGNHRNEHFSNLELVTNTENQRRKNALARKAVA